MDGVDIRDDLLRKGFRGKSIKTGSQQKISANIKSYTFDVQMSSSPTESTQDKKRQRLNTKLELDRLSLLSEPLLTRILSFLPTKEAVKTGVLSRRWRNIWTHVSSFDFDQRAFPNHRDNNNFMNFVDRVLILCCSNSNLKKFRLHCCCGWDESRVEGWIYYAKRRFIEVVELELDGDFHKVPYPLFTCQSLMKMKLDMHSHSLRIPFSINLPKLKALQLVRVDILYGGGSIDWLISRCPKIEYFSMERCNLRSIEILDFSCCFYLETLSMKKCKFTGLKNFNVSSDGLKRLVLDGCHDLRECEMKISAPFLICFSYTGAMVKNFSAVNLLSPVDAVVDLDNMNGNRLNNDRYNDAYDDDDSSADGDHADSSIAADSNDDDEGDGNGDGDGGHDGNEQNVSQLQSRIFTFIDILKGLKFARSLRLCSAQLLSKSRYLLEMHPIYFPSLNSLKVSIGELNKDLVQVIVCILKHSPSLETLDIEYERDDQKGGCWKEEDFPFKGALMRLKEVEIKRRHGNENELNFAKFILKNAVVLESMVFICPNICYTSLRVQRCRSQELLRSPQASRKVAIVFL